MSIRRAWPRIELWLFLAAGTALVVTLVMGLRSHHDTIKEWLHAGTWRGVGLVLGGIAIYLGAHALRALRLIMLLGDERLGLRQTFAAHFLAAGVSLLFPFKLGEIYRVVEINRLLRQPAAAVLLVWSERVLDLLTISAGVLIALPFDPRPGQVLVQSIAPTLLLTLAVVLGTFVLFFAIPENIESAKLFIIRRYNSAWALRWLAALDAASRVIKQAPAALARRPITLAGMSILIWGLEVAALTLFLPGAMDVAGSILASVRLFFSHLIPGGGQSITEIASAVRPGVDGGPLLSAYPAAPFTALQLVAAAVFLGSIASRIRASRRTPASALEWLVPAEGVEDGFVEAAA